MAGTDVTRQAAEAAPQAAPAQEAALPLVSVIMPICNEERFIARSLEGALAQDYPPDRLEVIIADGMSTDRTRQVIAGVVAAHPERQVRVIDNPGRIVPTGLNAAIRAARGEVVIRMDGHCEYPRNYVRELVRLRQQTGAENVGGVLVPVGSSYTQRAICAAFYSPLSAGSAMRGFAASDALREVDDVHGGCYRREQLFEIGLFDEEMVRNQDDELNFRLRKLTGGRILQSPALQVKYHVRDSFRKLFRQYAQYGYWKVRVVQKHPRQSSPRHLVPSAFVLAVVGLAALAPFFALFLWAWLALLALYLAAIAALALREARHTEWKLWPGIIWALILMQVGYGVGFIVGVLRRVFGPLPTDSIFERVTR